jgi:hypothetical protein
MTCLPACVSQAAWHADNQTAEDFFQAGRKLELASQAGRHVDGGEETEVRKNRIAGIKASYA